MKVKRNGQKIGHSERHINQSRSSATNTNLVRQVNSAVYNFGFIA